MAVNIKSISHKKSSIVENGLPKLPTAAQLELGELAINFADGYETLSIKNSNNEIVTFTNDQNWKDKELVISNALNDLNTRIDNIVIPIVPTTSNTVVENDTNPVSGGGVFSYVSDIEEVTASALADLDSRIPDNIVTGTSAGYVIWSGTQAQYNALSTYDNNTIYLIKET